MNKLFSLGLNLEEIQKIGIKLGADVPAAFFDTPLIARGIGEKIEVINTKFKFYIIIIKPSFSCSTKDMYNKLDNESQIKQKYNSDIVKNMFINRNVKGIAENLYNVFENGVNDIEKIKDELIKTGALGSLMSGSGSCVYGIFDNKLSAKKAFKILNKKYETYFCVTK